jgi:class I fructose-bisphosphate aldolase
MLNGTPSSIGKNVHLKRILKGGKAVIFAFDHGFEHGPSDFEGDRIDPRVVVKLAVESKFDAIMAMPGIARATWDLWAGRIPMIIKLTGKTSLRPAEFQFLQYKIGEAQDAAVMGADAVAATVYWGAVQEDVMAERFAKIATECNLLGMPTFMLSYPRGPSIKDQNDPEIVRYAARASAEIGADLIKTYYTGSAESFRRVVEASTVPVMMSGGVKYKAGIDFLRAVENVMKAGGAGVVTGRNVFQSRDFAPLVMATRAIVHQRLTANEAADKFKVKG